LPNFPWPPVFRYNAKHYAPISNCLVNSLRSTTAGNISAITIISIHVYVAAILLSSAGSGAPCYIGNTARGRYLSRMISLILFAAAFTAPFMNRVYGLTS
jgi:hypothetical protein